MIIFINIPKIRFIALVGLIVIGIDSNIVINIAISFQTIVRYLKWNNRKKILTFEKIFDIIII